MSPPRHHLPGWSVLRVTGPDAAAFLHNLCTNEIKKLAEGSACEALFTNVKGRILAHTIVCRDEAGFHVIVTSPRAAELQQHLDKYHIREDLELQLVESAIPCLVWPAESGEGFALEALDARVMILDVDQQPPGESMGESEFTSLRIEHRFPLDGVDVDERNLPQELGRDPELISFTKGCYLGQETVARIDALGHVNNLLVRLRIVSGDSAPKPGDEITAADKAIGRVTTAAHDEASRETSMLGYVRREYAEGGTAVSVGDGQAEVLSAQRPGGPTQP